MNRLLEFRRTHEKKIDIINNILDPFIKDLNQIKLMARKIMEVYAMPPDEGETWNDTANRYLSNKYEGAILLKEVESKFIEAEGSSGD